jgi:large subunit ribosomal protein L17
MNRKGDNAEMAIIELVDFNENLLNDKASAKGAAKKTRRGRKPAVKKTEEEAVTTAETDSTEVK